MADKLIATLIDIKAGAKLRNYITNITVIKNNVSTSARYIIDAYDVEKDSAWVIKDNKGGNVLTPDGSYNADRQRTSTSRWESTRNRRYDIRC